MAYIDRDDAIRTAIEAHIKAVGHGISHVEAIEIAEAMENIPIADVVEVKAVEQLKWERDTAIKQLQSYGVGLGEDKELAEVKHGKWLSNAQTDEYICSECDGIAPVDSEKEDFYESNYCPNCGAKMDGDIKNTDHLPDVGKMELEITDFHIGNVSKMVLPWFSADNKSLLEKVLFFHKMDFPSEMDMELIVIIEGAMQPTVLFYDGINFYSEESNGDICFHKVTHWMPLPAPPEKGA